MIREESVSVRLCFWRIWKHGVVQVLSAVLALVLQKPQECVAGGIELLDNSSVNIASPDTGAQNHHGLSVFRVGLGQAIIAGVFNRGSDTVNFLSESAQSVRLLAVIGEPSSRDGASKPTTDKRSYDGNVWVYHGV